MGKLKSGLSQTVSRSYSEIIISPWRVPTLKHLSTQWQGTLPATGPDSY